MTSKVIWSNIFTGVIEVIQHHIRYYRAIALLLDYILKAVAFGKVLQYFASL